MSALPGVSQTLFQAVKNGLNDKYPDQFGNIRCVRRRFYHAQAVGSTLAASYTAFNAARSKGTTNVPGNGNLPQDQGYIIRSVHCSILAGVSVAGAADAEGAQMNAALAADYLIQPLAEWLHRVHLAGILTLKVGDFTLIDAVKDLTNFPNGGGLSLQTGVASNSATLGMFNAALAQNGTPDTRNVYAIQPYPWMPGSPLEATIEWPTAINPPSNVDAVLMTAVDGFLFTSGR